MQKPKVSVVIPCYRTEQYLDRCVKSVIGQTLADWEIILVDDESPDNIPQMCDDWATRDERIKVIHKKNAGLGMACNSGLSVATGKYVAFLDSDDWVDAEMYQTLYDTAEQYGAQMVFTGLKRVNDEKVLSLLPHSSTERIYHGRKDVETFMLDMIASEPSDPIERHIQVSAKVVLYNRLHLKENRIIFENERQLRSEDLIFNLDALRCSDMVVILPYYFYNYYFNGNSITQVLRKDTLRAYEILYNELHTRYPTVVMMESYRNRIDRFMIGYLRSYARRIVSSKNISVVERYRLLKSISNSSAWKLIYSRYPIKAMPLPHRVFAAFVRYQFIVGLFFLFAIERRK
jgi:glycosyltransferase involved in cell wall biosynthesis